jgi:hypothetical protein
MSATEANAPATAQGAADDMEKALISRESAKAGAKATVVMDNGPNTVGAQAAHDDGNELDTITACGAQSLTLPNLTKPGDVDAAYYENWAREYCGLWPE